MKKILTIDFDIIMAPCIELYNNSVPLVSWDELYNIPQLKVLTPDYNIFYRLTNYLLKILPNLSYENIFIIDDHGLVPLLLKQHITDDVQLINIDHHHDLGYDPSEKNIINCANWVTHIPNLLTYTWIHDINSSKMPKEYNDKPQFYHYNFFDCHLQEISDIDMLILCLSGPWIPPTIRPLFFIWLDILNEYYHTHFEISDLNTLSN